MEKELGLTNDQKKRLQDSRKNLQAKMKAHREQVGGMPDMQQVMAEQQKEMDSILTAEQRAKMRSMMEAGPGGGFPGAGGFPGGFPGESR
jgi:hypothetical protein